MPFKSEKQRRYLWLKHPRIARRWAHAYGSKAGPEKDDLKYLLSRAELMGSRGRARLYGRPEPEDRDRDYVIFSDDREDISQIRNRLSRIVDSNQGYGLRERDDGYLTATSDDVDISVAPVSRKADILKAWSLIEQGLPKSEAWSIVNSKAERDEDSKTVLKQAFDSSQYWGNTSSNNTVYNADSKRPVYSGTQPSLSEHRPSWGQRLVPSRVREDWRMASGMLDNLRGRPNAHTEALNAASKNPVYPGQNTNPGASNLLYNLATNPGGYSASLTSGDNRRLGVDALDPFLMSKALRPGPDYGTRDRAFDSINAPLQAYGAARVIPAVAGKTKWLAQTLFKPNPAISQGTRYAAGLASRYLPVPAAKAVQTASKAVNPLIKAVRKYPKLSAGAAALEASRRQLDAARTTAGLGWGETAEAIQHGVRNAPRPALETLSTPEGRRAAVDIASLGFSASPQAYSIAQKLSQAGDSIKDLKSQRAEFPVNVVRRGLGIPKTPEEVRSGPGFTRPDGLDALFPYQYVARQGVKLLDPVSDKYSDVVRTPQLGAEARRLVHNLSMGNYGSTESTLAPAVKSFADNMIGTPEGAKRTADLGKLLGSKSFNRVLQDIRSAPNDFVADRTRTYGGLLDNVSSGNAEGVLDIIGTGGLDPEVMAATRLSQLLKQRRSRSTAQ